MEFWVLPEVRICQNRVNGGKIGPKCLEWLITNTKVKNGNQSIPKTKRMKLNKL